MSNQRWKTMIGASMLALPSIGLAQQTTAVTARPTVPATIRPATLADSIEEIAGQSVKIPNARIVEILEANAWLIEPATRYRQLAGQRDRILVLVDGATLRAPAESSTTSAVTVVGVARTLLGMRVSAEVPWPVSLDPVRVKQLEVRAAVLATSVQTAEGTELTDRR
jgi:hypothetical protein